MVDGGSYNGETVTGMGLTQAGMIQYRALAHYLTSASNFRDNYHALKQSCQDLIGVGGITCGQDAVDKLERGAQLVQFYTGMVYRGPELVSECLEAIAGRDHG